MYTNQSNDYFKKKPLIKEKQADIIQSKMTAGLVLLHYHKHQWQLKLQKNIFWKEIYQLHKRFRHLIAVKYLRRAVVSSTFIAAVP